MNEETINPINPEQNDAHALAGLIEDFDINLITAQEITDECARNAEEAATNKNGLFTVLPANDWIELAKNRQIPKLLFDEFWLEGEVCILFADTNVGKSILAVQIGDSISRGVPIDGFQIGAAAQKVLYFDFELSAKQFENRYSYNYSDHYKWNDNFLRVEIDTTHDIPTEVKFEDYLNIWFEQCIINTGAKVLIVDNITYLKDETERAKDALPLMKGLQGLKKKYDLSILALAHTPKRDLSKPITRNDLGGSKMLMNFCDTSFTIGESSVDRNLRYLKQVKLKGINIYDGENVCVCQVTKPDNFLRFEFMNFATEREHLKEITDKDIEERDEIVKRLHNEGQSLRQIATELNISHMKVKRILDKVEKL